MIDNKHLKKFIKNLLTNFTIYDIIYIPTRKKNAKMITRNEADEILSYVAQNIISPLAFDERKANEVWLELSGEKFNQLCEFVYDLMKEDKKNEMR